MVPSIIPPLLETPRQPHPNSAALPFERNLVIPKRRLPRQTSSGGPLQRPIWNTFLDPDQLPTVRISHDGMRQDSETSKELRGRVESIKWHSELRNFSLPRIHSSLGIPPGLCQDCWKSLEICPAATSSFLSPLFQCITREILLISSFEY